LLEVSIFGHSTLQRQHLLAGARAEGDAVRTGGCLQRPEYAGLVRIAVVVGHVGLALLLDEHPPTGEQLHQSGDDLVQHRLQRLVGWRGYFDEDRFAFGVAPVHAVQHQAVKVNVEIGGRTKSLDQRDRAAVSLLGIQPGLIEQVARDGSMHHLQHGRHQLRLCGQQQAQRHRQPILANPYPLAHRHVRDGVVHQVRRRLRHAPGPA